MRVEIDGVEWGFTLMPTTKESWPAISIVQRALAREAAIQLADIGKPLFTEQTKEDLDNAEQAERDEEADFGESAEGAEPGEQGPDGDEPNPRD
jgi:hypothetical protein